jgi:hypothetical protein
MDAMHVRGPEMKRFTEIRTLPNDVVLADADQPSPKLPPIPEEKKLLEAFDFRGLFSAIIVFDHHTPGVNVERLDEITAKKIGLGRFEKLPVSDAGAAQRSEPQEKRTLGAHREEMENGKLKMEKGASAMLGKSGRGGAGGRGRLRWAFGRWSGRFPERGRIEDDFSDALQGEVKFSKDIAAAGECAIPAFEA